MTERITRSQNNEPAAMLLYETNPVGVELFSHVNTFFCSNEFACLLGAYALWGLYVRIHGGQVT